MLATIIVLSNLAGVAVQFLYQFIGSAVNSEMISGLWEKKLINVVTCLVFLAIATYVAYRGVDTTERVQMVLVIFQLVMLAIFAVLAIAKSGASEVGQPRMHRRDLSEPGAHCETSRTCVIRSRRLRIP